MKLAVAAVAFCALPITAAHAENWVRVGVFMVTPNNEQTVYVDVDSVISDSRSVTFRARWVNRTPVMINTGPMKEAYVVQYIDCARGERFMLSRDDYDEGGRLIRRWRAPGGEPSPTANRRGVAGHLAEQFVCAAAIS